MAAVDFSRENLSTLVKDGISDELYKLLWAKDELNYGPTINIPDTIIYKYGQPVIWYFTSVNGRIKKKNKQNLLSAKIEEAFNKHVLGYDVVAYFITMASEHERSVNDTTTPTIIEYFDRAGLNNFLYNHKKGVNGILQRFIEPKSTHNELIRSIWSPKLCLLERAENVHQLHDHRYGLYERCVVYEGPDYYFTSAPLRGPVLSGQIQKLCESITNHISEVTYGQKQITRMVFNFKVDSRDKIWLLYSTSIRSDDMLEQQTKSNEKHLLNIDSVVALPESISLNPKKTYNPIVAKTRVTCLSCGTETLDELRYPVTYKVVIKHHDHVLHILRTATGTSASSLNMTSSTGSKAGVMIPWPPDQEIITAAGNVGFGCLNQDEDEKHNKEKTKTHHVKYKNIKDIQVPPMIAILHPKLNNETFARCKTDPLFQNKTIHLCESCYLVYAEFNTVLLRMGEDLKKLLTPDVNYTRASTAAFERPSSADWRAISSNLSNSRSLTANESKSTLPPSALKHHEEAKASAIGLRSSSVHFQPTFPNPIRSGSEGQVMMKSVASEGSIAKPFEGSLLDLGSQSLHEHINGYEEASVQQMIADRERKFFKEISLNPQLKDQHPLMHLITAQQKLQLVDQQSGVLMSKAASAKESVFSDIYGRQTTDKHQKYGPYASELPYAINGEIVLPSALRQRKLAALTAEKERKNTALKKLIEDETEAEMAKEQQGQAIAQGAKKSSKQYRNFLAESLQKIEAELGEAVAYPPLLDEVQDSGTKSKKPNTVSSRRSVHSKLQGSVKRHTASAPALGIAMSPAYHDESHTPVSKNSEKQIDVQQRARANEHSGELHEDALESGGEEQQNPPVELDVPSEYSRESYNVGDGEHSVEKEKSVGANEQEQ